MKLITIILPLFIFAFSFHIVEMSISNSFIFNQMILFKQLTGDTLTQNVYPIGLCDKATGSLLSKLIALGICPQR